MRLSRDNWIVLGILAVITLTYGAVVYRMQSGAMDLARAKVAERKRQIEADAAMATRVAPMVREIEAMKQRFNKDWDRRLPQRKELAGFLTEISTNLAQERLTDTDFVTGNPVRSTLYNCLPITMKFEGNFLSLAGFLKRVDEMARLTRVEQLVIESKKGAKELSVELGMNIYFTEY